MKKLEPNWDLAPGILALLEGGYADDITIDSLLQLINNSIKSIKKDSDKQALQKGLETIQKIKAMEEQEKTSDEDLDKLLAAI